MKKTALIAIIFMCLALRLFSADLVHILQKGETLYGLSRTYKVSVNDIMRANGIVDPSKLSIGMEIKIPAVYIVEKGDTYYSLAKRFGVTVDMLCHLNNADPSKVLVLGAGILVPGSEPVETAVITDKMEDVQVSFTDQSTKPYFWPHEGVSSSLSGKLEGLQFDGKDGDTIHSVSRGKVVWVGPYRGYNKIVFVQTVDDYIYGYGGNNDILVKVGDSVEPGTEIGRLGINPHEGKARMFFFVYRNGSAVDPHTAPRE